MSASAYDARCEICGCPGGMVVKVYILDAAGKHRVTTAHVVCENSRLAKMRAKAAHN